MIWAMPLHELHPFSDAEVGKIPRQPGVFVFFQLETPVQVDEAEDLRKAILDARQRLPRATHFALEVIEDRGARGARLQKSREELNRVRTAAFIPATPRS